ncbi:MAG TPA: nickel-dependent hydrogenase large subunit, partial [Longimicrobiales bacterium]|nr:nickel-dependent hydrogenase large subunit [Longimicrobiales bacterium]
RAQAVELAVDLENTRAALDRLINVGVKPERPVKVEPRAGTGTAITEAPRGILVHSYTYDDNGRIRDADVVTPTAINAASVEHHFAAAARRTGARDLPGLKRTLELVVRAYDPCISCSVHLVQRA